MQPRVRCVARRDHKVVNSVVNEMRGTSHQGARCYQRIRSQFLTSSRVNTHGRSPECGRRSKARRPRSGTAYVYRAVSRCRGRPVVAEY